MSKIIHIFLWLLLSLSAFSAKAQSELGFWDDVDFSDSSLVASKAFQDKIIGCFYSFTDGDENRFDSLSIAGLGLLLDKAKVNMCVYEYVLGFALNGFTSLGRDAVTDYLLNYPKLSEGEISIEEGLRLDSITEPYQKVKIGAKAPDFKGFTIDGDLYGICDSNATHCILVFWSTDCEYCHDFLVQIRKHLDLKVGFELVTFALAEDKSEVEQAVKKMRLPGYHFYDDKRWDGEAFLNYHVTSTPTVFILDEDKTIVCKPYDWKDLKQWLKSNHITY